MFDKVEITVKAGNGGDGAVSFRREKFVPYGGPDGGDGGDGGNVIVKAASGTTDYHLYRSKGIYKAGDGKRGSGKKKHGKRGDDLVLLVPLGTVVFHKTPVGDKGSIADLEQDKQQVVITKGGKGGLGNAHFATSTRQAPQIAQKGEAGQEIAVLLDLRLIADVGIVGYPNVGKSSLLAVASAAKPRIADYPFTTTEPVLGVVSVDYESFVLAEIPGLIAGANLGRGLGHDFLNHAIRTKIFIHLVDGASVSPVEDMIAVNNELALFDAALAKKPQIVAVNKVDLPEVRERMPEIRMVFKQAGIDVHFISAATKKGVDELMADTWQRLQSFVAEEQAKTDAPIKVFRPQPKGAAITVRQEGGAFIVAAPGLERMVSVTGEGTPELLLHVQSKLERLGLKRELQKAGAKPGDKVRCGELEWEWQ